MRRRCVRATVVSWRCVAAVDKTCSKPPAVKQLQVRQRYLSFIFVAVIDKLYGKLLTVSYCCSEATVFEFYFCSRYG